MLFRRSNSDSKDKKTETAPSAPSETERKTEGMQKSSSHIKYYIARPLDRFGNTFGPKAIIEAEIIESDEKKLEILGQNIKVLAPKEITDTWVTCNTHSASLVEVPSSYGPARVLTPEEHEALWKRYLKDSGPVVEAQETETLRRSNFHF